MRPNVHSDPGRCRARCVVRVGKWTIRLVFVGAFFYHASAAVSPIDLRQAPVGATGGSLQTSGNASANGITVTPGNGVNDDATKSDTRSDGSSERSSGNRATPGSTDKSGTGIGGNTGGESVPSREPSLQASASTLRSDGLRGTTIFLVSVALLLVALYLAGEAGRLDASDAGRAKRWATGSAMIVLLIGAIMRLPILTTPIVEFAPVLLVASLPPTAIGFISFRQIAALQETTPTRTRATVAQFVACLNFAASVATLLTFFRVR